MRHYPNNRTEPRYLSSSQNPPLGAQLVDQITKARFFRPVDCSGFATTTGAPEDHRKRKRPPVYRAGFSRDRVVEW